jgi:CubicO group peptidase (beta-lactamase class C family)
MWKVKVATVLFVVTTISAITVLAQSPALTPADRRAEQRVVDRLKDDVPKYMRLAQVPGASLGFILHGRLVWAEGFGVTNNDTKQPVTNQTIFEANSLSKPLFAFSVLRLVDQGKIDLDTPIIAYGGADYNVCDDPRFKKVNARMILSHSSGIVRDAKDPQNKVALAFNPGEKFQYSPTGYDLLSHLIEKMTGMKIEDFIQQYALTPLGMKSSSYVWQPAYDNLRIYQHDWTGRVVLERKKWERGAACCSLQTNAEDYAKFVTAVLNGDLLKNATWAEMMKPQVAVSEKFPALYWGLGWGLEKTEKGVSFWQWGDAQVTRNYISASLSQKSAVIWFTNSENGLSFLREVLDDAGAGGQQGALYLGYDRYDSALWLFREQVLKVGAPAALAAYRKQKPSGADAISEASMNQLGYDMLNLKRMSDAIALFVQNTADYPKSWNAWDSLAEAYMDNGDREKAIQDYRKSLELNPGNENGKEMLKKLGDSGK